MGFKVRAKKKKLEKLMCLARNERLQKTMRKEDEQCTHEVAKFRNRTKFRKPGNFYTTANETCFCYTCKNREQNSLE